MDRKRAPRGNEMRLTSATQDRTTSQQVRRGPPRAPCASVGEAPRGRVLQRWVRPRAQQRRFSAVTLTRLRAHSASTFTARPPHPAGAVVPDTRHIRRRPGSLRRAERSARAAPFPAFRRKGWATELHSPPTLWRLGAGRSQTLWAGEPGRDPNLGWIRGTAQLRLVKLLHPSNSQSALFGRLIKHAVEKQIVFDGIARPTGERHTIETVYLNRPCDTRNTQEFFFVLRPRSGNGPRCGRIGAAVQHAALGRYHRPRWGGHEPIGCAVGTVDEHALASGLRRTRLDPFQQAKRGTVGVAEEFPVPDLSHGLWAGGGDLGDGFADLRNNRSSGIGGVLTTP